jgi:hypothetical protein
MESAGLDFFDIGLSFMVTQTDLTTTLGVGIGIAFGIESQRDGIWTQSENQG